MTIRTSKRRWLQYGLRTILLVMILCAVVAAQFQPREIKASIDATGVQSERSVQFRLTNNSRNDLWFDGYGITSPMPMFSAQYEKNGKWQDVGIGWCGTGAQSVKLKAGESTVFNAWFDPPTANSIRVYLSLSAYSNGKQVKRISSEPTRIR